MPESYLRRSAAGFGLFLLASAVAFAQQGATITTGSPLPNGIFDQAYSTTLSCTNCAGLTYGLEGGTLPQGLSISPGGNIAGTPTAVGLSNFTVALYAPTSGQAFSQ